MIFNRVWAMPNKETFYIPPIKKLISKYITNDIWLDPFCRNSPFKSVCISNDLDPNMSCDYNMDALEFLKLFGDSSVYGVLFDPPYSPRQISECYKNVGREVYKEDTQASFYSKLKQQISRVLVHNGVAISFGWNSGGIGKKFGFEIEEILLVPHGGSHNDTICVVDKKVVKI